MNINIPQYEWVCGGDGEGVKGGTPPPTSGAVTPSLSSWGADVVSAMDTNTIIEGTLKFRDGKKVR